MPIKGLIGAKRPLGGLAGSLGGSPKKLFKKSPISGGALGSSTTVSSPTKSNNSSEKPATSKPVINDETKDTKPTEGDATGESNSNETTKNCISDEECKDNESVKTKSSKGGKASPKPEEKKEAKAKVKAAEKTTPTKPIGGTANKGVGAAAKAAKDAKVPFTNEEAEDHIAQFMEKNNRPYSYQDVLNMFQGRLKKPLCQKVLDDLKETNIITCKEYGKAKVYMINQDLFETATDEELEVLDQQIEVRKQEYIAMLTSNKELVGKFKEANCGDSNDRIKTLIEQAKKDILSVEAELNPYKTAKAPLITQDEINEAESNMKRGNEEWRRRRKACQETCLHFGEQAGMSRKNFIEKLEIETDEQLNVVCPI